MATVLHTKMISDDQRLSPSSAHLLETHAYTQELTVSFRDHTWLTGKSESPNSFNVWDRFRRVWGEGVDMSVKKNSALRGRQSSSPATAVLCGWVDGRVVRQWDGRGESRGLACRSILEHYQRSCCTQIQPLTYTFSILYILPSLLPTAKLQN